MNDNFIKSKSNPDINFMVIFLLLTQSTSMQTNFLKVLCVFVKVVSVLHANVRSVNKSFEVFKHFYSAHNWTFSVFFPETWPTNYSICKDSSFQILHQVRKSGRGRGLNILVHKEVYFMPRTDLSINSNDRESLCIEIHHEKYRNILFTL